MPPSKKNSTKKPTKASDTVSESDLETSPTADLPAITDREVSDLPDLDLDPSTPGGDVMDLSGLPDIEDERPTAAKLSEDMAKMAGKTSASTNSLANEFLPILSAKMDQLSEKMVGQFETLRTGIDAQVSASLKPVLESLSAQSKLLNSLFKEVQEQVIPAVIRMEGTIKRWEDGDDGEDVAEEVVEVQEKPAPAASKKKADEVAPLVSSALQDLLAKYAGAFKTQGNTPRPIGPFLSAVLDKHVASLDPATDTIANATAYIRTQGWINKDGQMQIP